MGMEQKLPTGARETGKSSGMDDFFIGPLFISGLAAGRKIDRLKQTDTSGLTDQEQADHAGEIGDSGSVVRKATEQVVAHVTGSVGVGGSVEIGEVTYAVDDSRFEYFGPRLVKPAVNCNDHDVVFSYEELRNGEVAARLGDCLQLLVDVNEIAVTVPADLRD